MSISIKLTGALAFLAPERVAGCKALRLFKPSRRRTWLMAAVETATFAGNFLAAALKRLRQRVEQGEEVL